MSEAQVSQQEPRASEEAIPEPPTGAEATAPQAQEPVQDPNDRLMGALAYIVAIILPLIVLLSETGKLRPFQRYHAIQSLALSVVAVVWTLLVFIASLIASAVCPPLGCILWVLYLAPAVPVIWAAYHAYNGEWVEIPGLTQFLRDQNWL
ncbi:MAG: DUF4870 domain-containing protein [Anaerolineae bacterium]|nr:DUF4870 domain-containing protein [Anaerolineae bacterium]